MKICFQMLVFQSNYVLSECLKSILPYGRVVVCEGPVAYWQQRGYTTSTDGTNEVLHRLLSDENIVHGRWVEKDEMMNAVLHLIPGDTTHVWMVDSDEVWSSPCIEKIMPILDNYDSVSFRPYSFYGGFDRYMCGFEEDYEWHRIQRWYPGAKWGTHRPPTVNAPDGKPWREHRHLNHMATDKMEVRFYHYSYVFPKQMKDKAEYYASMGGRIPDYFNRVYLPWVLGDRQKIEDEFDGVHDYLPEVRGPCRTVTYYFDHPKEIENSLDSLQEMLVKQLDEALYGK